ncbi:magnesium chelatase domain-containing protein [Streptomyces kronopolitis]|uniref:magnesium chelatase domain-containing protein n=1 Tax=Streptomyces kronopolitis TaxID=1612435 RepID=UPI003425C637
MSTIENTTTGKVREFIIAGQNQGTSYTLWDVAPAPTDPTKCAIALEELQIEAMDTFGEVTTMWADTARAAVDKLVASLREQSGLDDYGLSPDSCWDAYGPAGDATPDSATYGKAEAVSAAGTTAYRVCVSSAPGLPNLNVDGLPARHVRETRDRVRAGILNSGLAWPEANVIVRITAIGGADGNGGSSLDLAIACAILAASGQLGAASLAGTALIGELGLDGKVRAPRGLRDQVQAAADAGHPIAIVPDTALDKAGTAAIRLIGVSSLNEALNAISGHTHHPASCRHCHCSTGSAHRPCTFIERCDDCKAAAVEL